MAKKYVGVNTLQALMEILKAELATSNTNITEILNTMLKKDDIVRDITEYVAGEDPDDKVVAAQVVKELKDAVDQLTGGGEGGGAAITTNSVITDWEGYDEEADAEKVVAAALVKAIKDQVDALKTTVEEEVEGQKGQPGGLATLDETGKVPAEQLPSYVDDVLEGFMVNEGTDEAPEYKFYEPDEDGTAASATEIVGEKGKIYVDLSSNKTYRWSGTIFVEVSSVDLVEMTEQDVEDIWNEVAAEFAAKVDEDETE